MKSLFFYVIITSLCFSLMGCSDRNDVNSITNTGNDDFTSAISSSVTISETDQDTVNLTNNIIVVDYDDYFQKLDGCAIFYNSNKEEYHIYNEDSVDTRISPCSTFKIISTLLGLKYGVVSSTSTKMGYNGITYPVEEWNYDLDLQDAFQKSCIWYFRKIIDSIGPEAIQKELNQLSYGNCDINEWKGSNINSLPDINGFWLESSLTISPREQVKILQDIFEGNTEIIPDHVDILKELMLIEQKEQVTIYGKTGSGSYNSWFVGMIEKQEDKIYFAIHLHDKDIDTSGNDAKEIGINIITDKFNY